MPVRDQLRKTPAWTLAALLAVAYLALDPRTADLAAQVYRSDLFKREGFALWDNSWYGGHHLPGYSLLFPPLGALLGPRLVGAIAAVLAAWLFERMPVPWLARAAFATGAGALLFSNRLTFVLGVAIGVGALLALRARRSAASLALGGLTAIASPVAALFLALCAGAVLLTSGAAARRSAGACVAGALAPIAALAIAFPSGGTFPFEPDAFWPPLAATAVLGALIPAQARTLRAGVALYALLLVAAFAVPSQVGGNVVRLGALAGGAVAVTALLPRRRVALALLAPVLVYWQWTTPVDDWRLAARDDSTQAEYYRGVVSFLSDAGARRVEIPFTDNHWEAAHVAPDVALARGWERQIDRKVNDVLYRDGLDAPSYLGWLRENAVDYVALADAPLDYSAAAEAKLIRDGLPFLREVWRDDHWRVFAVTDATPLASGGEILEVRADEIRLRSDRRGAIVVRVRHSPYWRLVQGSGCVSRSGPWLTVTLHAPGPARVAMSFSALRIRADGPRCTH